MKLKEKCAFYLSFIKDTSPVLVVERLKVSVVILLVTWFAVLNVRDIVVVLCVLPTLRTTSGKY